MVNLFEAYNSCFFCGYQELGKNIDFNFENNKYIELIQKKYSLKKEEIISNLQLKECNYCNVHTFNKWFSRKILDELYTNLRHRMGWYKFNNTVLPTNYEILKNDKIVFTKLTNMIGPIKSWGEIWCPFLGLIPFFGLAKGNINLIQNNINNKIKILIKKIINRLRGRNVTRLKLKNLNTINLPEKIFFIRTKESYYGWGQSCSMYGQKCKSIINKYNFLDIIKFDDLKTLNSKIDLLYLSNTLDHVEDPLKKILFLSAFTKNIYIEYHTVKGGIQHPYFITKNTIKFLEKKTCFFVNKKFGTDSQKILMTSKN